MRNAKILPVAAAALLAFGAAGQARSYNVTHHANIQQGRINEGERTGALNTSEATHLQFRENNIRTAEQSDKAANGGYLTRNEKVRLGARQAALAGTTYYDKHNGQTAPAPAPQAAPPH